MRSVHLVDPPRRQSPSSLLWWADESMAFLLPFRGTCVSCLIVWKFPRLQQGIQYPGFSQNLQPQIHKGPHYCAG